MEPGQNICVRVGRDVGGDVRLPSTIVWIELGESETCGEVPGVTTLNLSVRRFTHTEVVANLLIEGRYRVRCFLYHYSMYPTPERTTPFAFLNLHNVKASGKVSIEWVRIHRRDRFSTVWGELLIEDVFFY
jgi:hypothetical protein